MLECVRVAAVAVDSQPGEVQANVRKIAQWASKAKEAGAQLALFPELSLTGFIPNHPTGNHETWLCHALRAARQSALAIDGAPVHQLVQAANELELLICVGLLEDAGNRLFNAQLLIGGQGVIGHWRKLHVPMFEMPFYNGGSSAPVAVTSLGRIGVNICFDALMPESTRLLAVQNVEMVLMPFAADPPPCTPSGWADWAAGAIRARAIENGVFVVACNYVGRVDCVGVRQDFPGGGLIVSPRGEPLAEWNSPAGQPGMIVADLRAEQLAAARSEPEYLFRFRRPELYGPLSKHE